MQKIIRISLILFLNTSFLFAQYNNKIVNRSDVYNHIGFNINTLESFILGDYLYACTKGMLYIVELNSAEIIKVLETEFCRYLNNRVIVFGKNTCLDVTEPLRIKEVECEKYNKIIVTPYYRRYKFRLDKNLIKIYQGSNMKLISELDIPEASPNIHYLTIPISDDKLVIYNRNLYFIDLSDLYCPKIVQTYCFEVSESDLKKQIRPFLQYKDDMLFVTNNKQIICLNIADFTNAKLLKTHDDIKINYRYQNVTKIQALDSKFDQLLVLLVAGGAEGYDSYDILLLTNKNRNKTTHIDRLRRAEGYPIAIVPNYNKLGSTKYFCYDDFHSLFIHSINDIDNPKILHKINDITSIAINKDFAAIAGTNDFNDKILLFQNNNNGTFSLLKSMKRNETSSYNYLAFHKNNRLYNLKILPGYVSEMELIDLNNYPAIQFKKITSDYITYQNSLHNIGIMQDYFFTTGIYNEELNFLIYQIKEDELSLISFSPSPSFSYSYLNVQFKDHFIWYYKEDNQNNDKIYFSYPQIDEHNIPNIKSFAYPAPKASELSKEENQIITFYKDMIELESKKGSHYFPECNVIYDGFLYKSIPSGGINVFEKKGR